VDLVHKTVNQAALRSTVDPRTEPDPSSPVLEIGSLMWEDQMEEDCSRILTMRSDGDGELTTWSAMR
jgi:hypothetical protein